jgi:hypothetical protein
MTNDTGTYRAVQAVAPGQLELTTKALREPPPGYVRIFGQHAHAVGRASKTLGLVPFDRTRISVPPPIADGPPSAFMIVSAPSFPTARSCLTRAEINSGQVRRTFLRRSPRGAV